MEKEEYEKATLLGVESAAELRAENWRLRTQCEILGDIESHKVHEWYHDKLSALYDWARKQPEEIKRAFFGCMANGSTSVYESPKHSQLLVSLKYALEKSEREVNSLKQELKEAKEENAALYQEE